MCDFWINLGWYENLNLGGFFCIVYILTSYYIYLLLFILGINNSKFFFIIFIITDKCMSMQGKRKHLNISPKSWQKEGDFFFSSVFVTCFNSQFLCAPEIFQLWVGTKRIGKGGEAWATQKATLFPCESMNGVLKNITLDTRLFSMLHN